MENDFKGLSDKIDELINDVKIQSENFSKLEGTVRSLEQKFIFENAKIRGEIASNSLYRQYEPIPQDSPFANVELELNSVSHPTFRQISESRHYRR